MNRVVLTILLLCISATAAAQASRDRAGSWEVAVQLVDFSSESLGGQQGASLEVDDQLGWGAYVAYNFTNRFALGGEFIWASPDYTATRIIEGETEPDTISAELDIFTFNFKGTFYLLEGPLTPYLEAGLGWTRVDSNILDGPPTTGCWWDPWWGYICDTFFSTYAETRTSYGTALGVRWDLESNMSLRASYGFLELDTSSATEDASMDTLRVDFSWRF